MLNNKKETMVAIAEVKEAMELEGIISIPDNVSFDEFLSKTHFFTVSYDDKNNEHLVLFEGKEIYRSKRPTEIYRQNNTVAELMVEFNMFENDYYIIFNDGTMIDVDETEFIDEGFVDEDLYIPYGITKEDVIYANKPLLEKLNKVNTCLKNKQECINCGACPLK